VPTDAGIEPRTIATGAYFHIQPYAILRRRLVSEVSIVFHSAATVKFDEELTKSVAMNVGAVLSIVNLCKKMPNLEVRYSKLSRAAARWLSHLPSVFFCRHNCAKLFLMWISITFLIDLLFEKKFYKYLQAARLKVIRKK
jgi:hypothetical protein